jgi:YD repeat-containing protein
MGSTENSIGVIRRREEADCWDATGSAGLPAPVLAAFGIKYDANQLLRIAGPSHFNTQRLTHGYDAVGNRTRLNTWFGRLSFGFDGRRLLTTLHDPQAGRSTWSFDGAAQVIQRQLPDGSTASYSYDGAGRLTGVLHKDAAGAVLEQAILAYDRVGNPLTKTTLDGIHSYSYDQANQLLSEYHPLAGIKSWSFDPAGNRLSQDYTQGGVRTLTAWVYDAADQLQTETTGTAVTSFTFDAAGNELIVQTPTEVTSNQWDGENRLTQIQLPDGSINSMSYRWDNLRHRLFDSEGDKRMVWDDLGSSGYKDLLSEETP